MIIRSLTARRNRFAVDIATHAAEIHNSAFGRGAELRSSSRPTRQLGRSACDKPFGSPTMFREIKNTCFRWLRWSVVLLALSAASPAPAQTPEQPKRAEPAQPAQPPQIAFSVVGEIDRLGNVGMNIRFKFAPEVYKYVVENTRPPVNPQKPDAPRNPDPTAVLRRMSWGQAYYQIAETRGSFDDASSSLDIRTRILGLAKAERGDRWECAIADDFEPTKAETRGNILSIEGIMVNPTFTANVTYTVAVPDDAKELQLLRSPLRVAYRLAAPETRGTKRTTDFDFEVQPQVMAGLAKIYGYPKFPALWLAKSVFRNTGDTNITNYRVRFRLNDFTGDWSPWHRCSIVQPGQVVCDGYFPVIDIEKAAKLDSRRPASVKIEYEYTTDDGKTVRDDDSRNLEIFGRNEVVYSSLKPFQCKDFQDVFNFGPFVLGSFVNANDPVVQQVAGLCAGRKADGTKARYTDKEALYFLESVYMLLQQNNIAYVSPQGQNDATSGLPKVFQHVKYARDVLRNRSGTCIDLSIFVGSVCEVVGLEPVLFLVPGHCFTGIKLPGSKNVVGFDPHKPGELNFLQALELGEKQRMLIAEGKMPAVIVDIAAIRSQGVYGLDMPALPADILTVWKIEAPKGDGFVKVDGNGQPQPQPQAQANSLTGVWSGIGNINGTPVTFTFEFKADGSYTGTVVSAFGTSNDFGKYSVDNAGGYQAVSGADGSRAAGRVAFKDRNEFTYTPQLGNAVVFKRVK